MTAHIIVLSRFRVIGVKPVPPNPPCFWNVEENVIVLSRNSRHYFLLLRLIYLSCDKLSSE
jgi:hypothetical protein